MFLGIDPDLHHTGLAVCDEDGSVLGVECCTIATKLKGDQAVIAMIRAISGSVANIVEALHNKHFEAVAIEGQHITFRTPNPKNIIQLAHVTGGIAGIVNEQIMCKLLIPEPQSWKGQVPKIIHQRRILKELGWECVSHGTKKDGYTIPTKPPCGKMFNQTMWKHAVDAIGLARWCYKQRLKDAQNARARENT